ncbi:tail protein X [Acidaminococcus sp.]|uniref:tail protein X n=1 Tax=Acidaminococcus sp. TaxID=1872103 RepID=UPI003D7F049E
MSKIYTTVQGDVWDFISYKVYGSERYIGTLMEANPKHADTAVFPSGVILTCPDVETPVSRFLPPWKEG